MDDLLSLLGSEDNEQSSPTFRNMLLLQVSRLKDSSDPLDQQLRNYLLSIIKDKGYSEETWINEIEEVELIHRLVKKGKSVSSAVDSVAEKSKRDKQTLQEKYAEYEKALIEIDQIFQEPGSKDPG